MTGSRLASVLVVLLALVGAKLGHELYRWHAYAGEREQLRALTSRLEEAGYELVRTQVLADSLRAEITAMDRTLAGARGRVNEFERRTWRGALPAEQRGRYTAEVDSYNRLIRQRNDQISRWEDVVGENHEAVARFNRLADSVRQVAAAMGEPYYPIPTPVELAARRGLTPLPE